MDNKQEERLDHLFNKAVVAVSKMERAGAGVYTTSRAMFDAGYDAGHSDAAKWIRIEDGLPESGKTYDVTFFLLNENLGTRSRLRTITAYYMNGTWRVSEYTPYVDFNGTVIAWRERPEPFTDSTEQASTDRKINV